MREEGTSLPLASVTPRPLPGTDWNDEARDVFVEELASDPNVQAAASFTGVNPEVIAGCVYFEVWTSDITFDQLQEVWVADEFDPDHPAINALEEAVDTCAIEDSA